MDRLTIAVASGKGGTGKTTVSTNLAYALAKIFNTKKIKLIDCDVEEPNSGFFFPSKHFVKKEDVGILVPVIDENKCTYCGIYAKVCEFGAIAVIPKAKKTYISYDLCHGCGACSYFCPEKAISEQKKVLGVVTHYKIKDNLNFVEGRLNVGESIATPVLRETLKNINKDDDIIILDAPPGTSCPVVTSIEKSDFVLLVAEPTPFGIYDLGLSIDLVKDMKKPFAVVINKAGITDDKTIYRFLKERSAQLLLEIPFKRNYAFSYSEGKLLGDVDLFKKLYDAIVKTIST